MKSEAPILKTPDGPYPAFALLSPEFQSTPLVFCSPHSGRAYPVDFLEASRLSAQAIRRSEDLFIDDLFDFAPDLGIPFLVARFPRAYLDVNREPYELDPKMFSEALPSFVNTGSLRVAGGLGTIPRIVAEREQIYRHKLSVSEGLRRIESLHFPFHATLEDLMRRTRAAFGMATLIDCHSMPSTVRAFPGSGSPDIVIGDRFGTSASGRIVAILTACLVERGYDVARNKPYAGGYITERYGHPSVGIHAVQVEINRGLYADEANFERHDGFDQLRADLVEVVGVLAAELGSESGLPMAAE
ncbi:N-formylglutamate amidohydrolase [Consotaella aegiceratis]|uniref:N-formylglutamate amidohydrolase n=1 Tax=Consotaella aegiceratis TaxID=3097961 RepID=UPI002F40386F